MAFYNGLSEKNKARETRSMTFYNGLSEKIKFSVVLLRLLLYFKIKASEARSMAFYRCLREKSKVHGDDFKNR
ncbi:hypothetical protein T4B_8566 [Trichinella pseudospiralis]|uniref:Uncharacterized protein n=1 Tax=Trichinella pseudospiralis TaxID=6337 RepID=A0A0V1GIH9_TRIPS|nr:hypothetical protein T4B_8566 [Trichinella pseudospiralis]